MQIGLHYEQDYHSHNFKADIFKDKIKCSRQFKGSISSETFEVTPKKQMVLRRNMAEDEDHIEEESNFRKTFYSMVENINQLVIIMEKAEIN